MKLFNLANILTLCNLISGCMAIYYLQFESWQPVFVCLFVSLVCDFLDGFVARWLKQQSELGGQLDSLADMVSFGALPGFALFYLLQRTGLPPIQAMAGFLFTAAAAMRLAKFNLDDRQTKDFLGLNTPAATIGIMGIYYAATAEGCTWFMGMANQSVVLFILLIIFSILLLIDLPMLSFKPDNKNRARTVQQVILVLGMLIIFGVLKLCGLFVLIAWYIIFSLINHLIKR